MVALAKIPVSMSLDEFLTWDPGDGRRWQLVDGEPQAMAPASNTHGELQSELARVIGNHFLGRESPCRVVTSPGVIPRMRAKRNFRIPDLGVSCSRHGAEHYGLTEPVLLVEILSPSNEDETWANVWSYGSIPSVREILILHTAAIGAELLRRMPDGSWPEEPETTIAGDLMLESIDFRIPLAALYRTTRLAL
jgi:Uma2 family endonuclease